MVFDEPTSALTEHEAQNLFGIIRRLKDRGVAIVYISHRLGEVMAIADRVTALRDGHLIATRDIADVNQDQMVELIVGRTIAELFPKQQVDVGEPVLEVRNLSRPPKFENISFSVRAGEVVGMAGLVGAGRTEIARAIFGLDNAPVGPLRSTASRFRPGTSTPRSVPGSASCPRSASSTAWCWTRRSARTSLSLACGRSPSSGSSLAAGNASLPRLWSHAWTCAPPSSIAK